MYRSAHKKYFSQSDDFCVGLATRNISPSPISCSPGKGALLLLRLTLFCSYLQARTFRRRSILGDAAHLFGQRPEGGLEGMKSCRIHEKLFVRISFQSYIRKYLSVHPSLEDPQRLAIGQGLREAGSGFLEDSPSLFVASVSLWEAFTHL